MERILDVAQFIFEEYKKQAGKAVDEMKLHKLLYFAQRENMCVSRYAVLVCSRLRFAQRSMC